MNSQTVPREDKQPVRGHNLDMRVQAEQQRMRDIEFMNGQGHFRNYQQYDQMTNSQEEMSNPRTPPFAKISKPRMDESRDNYCTGVGSFMTQHSTNHQPSSLNAKHQMGMNRGTDQYQMQSVSPFNQKYYNSGNRQNYGVSRFIRRGTTPHEAPQMNFMTSQFMMNGNQNSQRKVLRSAINEHRQGNFGMNSGPGSQKMKNPLRPSASPDNMEEVEMPHNFQLVRPFESQHKDMYNSGYESQEFFKMPMPGRSQTPQRTKMNQPHQEDDDHPEMIIPKEFS